MSFPKDSSKLKLFVATLACLETAQTAMIYYDALEGYAIDFGSVEAFDNIHLAWLDIPFTTSISEFSSLSVICWLIFQYPVTLFVQSFFAWRIYNLSKNYFIVALVGSVSSSKYTIG